MNSIFTVFVHVYDDEKRQSHQTMKFCILMDDDEKFTMGNVKATIKAEVAEAGKIYDTFVRLGVVDAVGDVIPLKTVNGLKLVTLKHSDREFLPADKPALNKTAEPRISFKPIKPANNSGSDPKF